MKHLFTLLLTCLLATATVVAAPPKLPREFRGAWIATVANIDWPSKPGLSAAEQQAELVKLFDTAVELNLNAIVLQVRPACDALYKSELEPWSEYLTGEAGKDPGYDPLEFAVKEAHARGLQLHAWLNPYRASHPTQKSAKPKDHIAKRLPESVVEYGDYLWLDPGDEAAVKHSIAVLVDVVKRYDVDGVHFDDYFYPYPVAAKDGKGNQPFPDDGSWASYQKRTPERKQLARDDWRRENVNQFIKRVSREVRRAKPDVLFGVSPFGIWRPGHPPEIKGFDPYVSLYADSKLWLEQGWVDYFAPQLYWPIASSGQSYPVLLKWWTEQNPKRKLLWAGNYTSMANSKGWSAQEIVDQIVATRAQDGATGNIHFSMKALAKNYGGVAVALREGPYAQGALVPVSGKAKKWGAQSPGKGSQAKGRGGKLELRMVGGEAPWVWAIQARDGNEWRTQIVPGEQKEIAWPGGDVVFVTAINRAGAESERLEVAAP